MAELEYVVVYAAAYPTVAAAQAVLDTIGHHVVGADYDAAVIDQENGKPHVVKRLDHRLRSRDSRVRRAVDNHLLQLSHHRAGLGARQGRAGQY